MARGRASPSSWTRHPSGLQCARPTGSRCMAAGGSNAVVVNEEHHAMTCAGSTVRLAIFLRGHLRRLRPWRHLSNRERARACQVAAGQRGSGSAALRAVLRRRAFGGTAAKDQSASSSACFRWGHNRFGRDPERAWEHSRSSPAPTIPLAPLATTLLISDPPLRETLSHNYTRTVLQ